MSRKRKRRLTKEELEDLRAWMEAAPPDKKPNIRQIAKRYGVNQPSVVKSLGGWKGIRRGRPEPPKRPPPLLDEADSPLELDVYTKDIKPEDIKI